LRIKELQADSIYGVGVLCLSYSTYMKIHGKEEEEKESRD
jgi:hypothetical protein